MRIPSIIILQLSMLLFLLGCDPGIRSKDAIHLPEGNAAKGREHFIALGCVACHTVLDEDLPEPVVTGPVRVLLGSRTGRALSYGQLVTSIVNPSHRLSARYPKKDVSVEGTSLMTVYNDVLTVTQLADIVAFLESHYEKAARPGYRYPVYKYGAEDRSR